MAEAELENYSVHSFHISVACALLAAGALRWLIKRMLRWRGDESSRLNYMDFSEETTVHFNAVAQSMLTLGMGWQRNTPETI